MEAKDTVMSQKQFERVEREEKWEGDCESMLLFQAEISFKAGIQEGRKLAYNESNKESNKEG